MLQSQLSKLKSSKLVVKEAFCESLTVVCSWCGKKCINENHWEHIYISPESTISHGICPECSAKFTEDTKEINCAWCGKKYFVKKNLFTNDYISKDANLSHGICPECITDIIDGIGEIDK